MFTKLILPEYVLYCNHHKSGNGHLREFRGHLTHFSCPTMFLAQSDKPNPCNNSFYHTAPRPSSQIPPKADPRPTAASTG